MNPENIDVKKHALYIIERIMDFGEPEEVKWMWNFYDKRLFKKVVVNPRRLLPMSKGFWRLMLNIKKTHKTGSPMEKFERDMEEMKKPF